MKYSFTCPPPCNHEIKVDAANDDEAVAKIMQAGESHKNEAHPGMEIPEEQMKGFIRMMMKKV